MKKDGRGITGIFPIINGESSKHGNTTEKPDGNLRNIFFIRNKTLNL
jgi:hypothetical protein